MLPTMFLIGAVLLLLGAGVQHAEGVQVMSPDEQVDPRSIDDEQMGSIEHNKQKHDLGEDIFFSGDLEDESHLGREEVNCVEGGYCASPTRIFCVVPVGSIEIYVVYLRVLLLRE